MPLARYAFVYTHNTAAPEKLQLPRGEQPRAALITGRLVLRLRPVPIVQPAEKRLVFPTIRAEDDRRRSR